MPMLPLPPLGANNKLGDDLLCIRDVNEYLLCVTLSSLGTSYSTKLASTYSTTYIELLLLQCLIDCSLHTNKANPVGVFTSFIKALNILSCEVGFIAPPAHMTTPKVGITTRTPYFWLVNTIMGVKSKV